MVRIDRAGGHVLGRGRLRIARACLLAFGFLLATLSPAPASAQDKGLPVELAVMETPVGTTLGAILSGRAQPGFTPLLTPGFPFAARDGTALWVRIRVDLPPGDSARWRLVVPRVPLDRLRLRVSPSGQVVAEDSFFLAATDATPWPANFELALPSGLAGRTELYLEIEGKVSGGLHLRLMDTTQAALEAGAAQRLFRYTYLLFLLVAALSLVRHYEDPHSGGLAVGAAAMSSWLACLGINGHLYSLPEVARLATLGATVPLALFLLGAGPLVLATRYYSGLSKSAPGLVPWMRGLGWLLIGAAVYSLLFLPSVQAHYLQWAAWGGYVLALLACLLMLLLDSRSYRWGPVLALLAVTGAALMRVLADRQLAPASLFNLYGAQLMLAVAMALYLGLPWIRARLKRWAMRKRAEPPEPSAEEKIALARKRLEESLQAGLKNAADGDLKWIAFRRLLDGLKPVLSQTSAAVVAMHFQGEDLLQTEPPSAEPHYRELLAQRSTLLKNLSRLRAPQQIGIDFDGPGPLEQVQLALIPLPIPRPGWGALLVERPADVSYSENELALCAEFAAMAIMAGDEASSTVNAQRTADTDPTTKVLRTEPLRQLLGTAMDAARLKQQPISLLYVVLDQLPALREAGGEVGAATGLRPVADLLQEEIAYGDQVGRSGPDGFLVIAHGRRLLEARDYADRLRTAVTRLVVDPRIAATGFSISVGVAQAGPDERDPAGLVERAGRAAQIANKNGGNQIFS
jgi:diguanylate cyclase (GGDEF)-like protein